MILPCLVIVGTLCAPYFDGGIAVVRSSMVGDVAIKTSDWWVSQELNSDCSGCSPDKAKFVSLCADGECISYFRRCDDADHPTACSYNFDKYPPVSVIARTEADFKEAVGYVGLVADNARSSKFLLSDLSKEGPSPARYASPPHNWLREPASKGDSK